MSEQTRTNGPWKVALLAGMASYLDAGALISSGLAVGTLFEESMHLSGGTVGGILGVQTLMVAAGAVLGGRSGDRYGRRKVFTFSLMLFAAGATVLLAATGPAMVWIGATVIGAAIGADLPASLAMISEEAPVGMKGKMVALSELLWGAGIVVASLLGAITAGLGVLGARLLFAHLLVVALLVLVLRMTLGESAEWARARQTAATADKAAADSAGRGRLGPAFRKPVIAAVAATGLYYAAWGVGANTLGQFGSYIFTHLTDHSMATWSLISLLGIPLSVGTGLILLRVVDTPARGRWFAVGSALLITAWALPVFLGPTAATLAAASILLTASTGLAGETMYKVWSQELVPTLLRATVQGTTFAFNRVVAAGFAFATPALARHHPTLLFSLVLALAVGASLIGLLWIPRLSKARELDHRPPSSDARAVDISTGVIT